MSWHWIVIVSSDAATLNFNGSQGLYVTKPQEQLSQAEDLVFRFLTSRPSGLLMRTWASPDSAAGGDSIEVALISGQLRVSVRIGDKLKVSVMNWYFLSSETTIPLTNSKCASLFYLLIIVMSLVRSCTLATRWTTAAGTECATADEPRPSLCRQTQTIPSPVSRYCYFTINILKLLLLPQVTILLLQIYC